MFRSPKLAALGAGLATCVALALPGAASAAVQPPVVEGNKVTVTSTENSNDTITLTVVEGNIAVNGTKTTLPADVNAEIAVNAGEGDDLVDASALALANYKTLVLHGDAGNDLLTGGIGNDELFGDAGEDRLVGFKGGDQARGGEGNDLIIWNNGDGTDPVNDGEVGSDEVEINGAPTAADEDLFRAVSPTELHFERANLVKFSMEIKAERMTINGLGGDDVIKVDPANAAGVAATKTAVTINGGIGKDTVVGSDASELITGGDGEDKLSGGLGNDRIVGDRGVDTMIGEAGDDTLVWNNGDAADLNDGGPGFDRAEENGGGEGDQFKLVPAAGGNATFERTNLVPFTVKLASLTAAVEPNGGIESVVVNGLGGDDTFVASPGLTGLSVVANGDAGNDTLTGAEEADSFFGGLGNDTITPGAGADLADGGEGDDTLMARDNAGDLVRGGAGTDSAQTDATTVDAVDGVEKLDATKVATPPSPDTKALLPTLGKIAVKKSGKARIAMVPLSCPAAETGGCRVTVTLETAKAAHLGSVSAVVVLGSKTVKIAGGKRMTAPVRLAPGAAALARGGKLATRVRLASSDAAGNTAVRTTATSLRLSK